MERKTPLYDTHLALGGKIVPFGGYLLPVEYSGIIPEHMAVREKAGLFDVSHMGELAIRGKGALATLNHILSNDFTGMKAGKVRYSPMLNEAGGVMDDLLVYKRAEEDYLLVVNASNREKDAAWIAQQLRPETELIDRSDETALLALQGPASRAILQQLADEAALPTAYYSFAEDVPVGGIPCLVSRTGYTGSFGYELYCKASQVTALWSALLEAGASAGLLPCGLGARDTLRLEAGMPLYGHEMTEEISPLETGLDFAVKMDKADFIGKAALLKRGTPTITRVGLKITGRGIVREDCELLDGETPVGRTTSGTHMPYLKGAYAMALVAKSHSAVGTALTATVRGRAVAVEVVPLPFYQP